MSQELAEQLASYAHELEYADLDADTIETVTERVIDSLACAYAGLDHEPVQNVRRYATTKTGEPTASILCDDRTASVEHAALANGTLIRYLDWNDTYLSAEPAHPSDNLGAILSVADAYDNTGKETIRAIVLGYEIQCRLCDAASLRTNGFDHVNYGLVSVPLAVGTLMGLSVEELTHAVNIALNSHVALRQARSGELSPWKGIAFANVARNGVVAAELAQHGINGPAPIFEGTFGFFNQVSGEFSLDPATFGGNNGEFKINQTHIKFYPIEYHAQAAVNCALSLRDEHDIDWQSIERIENETYEAAVSIIAGEDEKWQPETRETADHSMPYCIARAFIDGELTIEQFTDEKIHDTDVQQLMETIEVTENEEYTEEYGDGFPHRIIVHTDDDSYEESIDYPKGHADNPLTDEEREEKFTATAEEYLSRDRIDELLEWVRHLDEQDDIYPLFPR
jgi:2-methylcitrate dehydratase